ncbi:MAG: YeeE/YedE family protein [Flavisolibacter sp.]|nr:YeeE/YedE family protein [Flavisolibacter sp.]
MLDLIKQPWPWYVAGAVVGLTVPALLILGNKHFGLSANLRHLCAACLPCNVKFFKYDWKKETWNLVFATGIMIGAFIAAQFLSTPDPIQVAPALASELEGYGITNHSKLLPPEIFSFQGLLTLRGFILLVGGGFLVGFGTRYAGGCTSGHAIMGLSTLQWPSLIATISFMAGGFLMANFLLPLIMKL